MGHLFKTGQIDEITFIQRMNIAMNTHLSEEVFKSCWNAMCEIDEDTKEFLSRLQTLQSAWHFTIEVIANTNSLHHAYITDQLLGEKIPLVRYTLSFEEKRLDPELPIDKDARIIDVRNSSQAEILDILEDQFVSKQLSSPGRLRP